MARRARYALAASLLVLVGACADSPSGSASSSPGPRGGTLVIGAEQEPDCLDLIGSCAGASWGYWTGFANTVPRAFDVVEGAYRPSVLLDDAPTLETEPKQRVTYRIREAAVWSDGTPITSSDFKYTWTQIVDGNDIYSKIGYDRIESVDDTDPRTAVVTFKDRYAPWRDLFSAFYGVLPRHLLEKGERAAQMKDGYRWSGGPFAIESWRKGQDMTLVPNPRFWGRKPLLDKVVFQFISDQSAEIQAYRTGQVKMIYPQPQIGFEPAQVRSLPDTRYVSSSGLTLEGLWFNARKPPLDSANVRRAIAYAIDRDAIVNQLVRPIEPSAVPLQAFNAPQTQGGRYFTPAFARYTRDLAKVQELMSADGWTRPPGGVWTKRGTRAALEINSTAGNKGRELVEQLLQSQLGDAGFEVRINNTKAGTLFGEWLPKGLHMIGMYAQVLTPDPDFCAIICGDQIPGTGSGAGQNYQFFSDPAVDVPWKAQLRELDDARRAELVLQGHAALADAVPALPLYVKPQVLVWSAKLGGPIATNETLGPFWNMNQWHLKR